VRSADKEREPVPVASDAERPLPDARRSLSEDFGLRCNIAARERRLKMP
jgi:hypothetical protein